MTEGVIDRKKIQKRNTNIKKVSIYFDDGSLWNISSPTTEPREKGLGDGDGDGEGIGKPSPPRIRYKYGEILDISNGFVYFLETKGNFSMIPVCRVFRINGGQRAADEFL